jgi:hypothetical protein
LLLNFLQSYSTCTLDRSTHFRRDAIARGYISDNVAPNPAIIAEMLDIDAPITMEHMVLCESIVNQSVKLPLPVPRSEHVLPFSEVAGPENTTKQDKIKPGCYKIYNATTGECYIGHTIKLPPPLRT